MVIDMSSTKGPGAWSPADATKRINHCAKRDDFQLSWTFHAKERLNERELIVADVLHLLRSGFVYEGPEEASRDNFFKYKIEGTTPNSEGRTVRLVIIPDGRSAIKIVTVMWRDEK